MLDLQPPASEVLTGLLLRDGVGASSWDRDGGTPDHSPLGDYSGAIRGISHMEPRLFA